MTRPPGKPLRSALPQGANGQPSDARRRYQLFYLKRVKWLSIPWCRREQVLPLSYTSCSIATPSSGRSSSSTGRLLDCLGMGESPRSARPAVQGLRNQVGSKGCRVVPWQLALRWRHRASLCMFRLPTPGDTPCLSRRVSSTKKRDCARWGSAVHEVARMNRTVTRNLVFKLIVKEFAAPLIIATATLVVLLYGRVPL